MSHEFLGALSLSAAPAHPHLDVFMLTGFLLAFFQIACYISRRQSRDMAIGLLLTCIGLCVYAIVAGVWPLAMVQCALAVSAALRVTRRFRSQRRHTVTATMIRAEGVKPPSYKVYSPAPFGCPYGWRAG